MGRRIFVNVATLLVEEREQGMARVSMTICDRHQQQGQEVPATARTFVIDGFKESVDLCDECYERQVVPFLDFLRGLHPAPASRRQANSQRRRPRSKKPTADSSDVRAWAVKNGIEVSPRGRLRQEVIDQYLAALA